MGDTTVDISLDPKNVLNSIDELKKSFEELAQKIDTSLGKDAPKSVTKMEEAAERGSTRISGFFRNLGTRIKEDLKTAFDATGILAGTKFAEGIGHGVKQVFEMERAFDRLNTRLRLSTQQMADFKKEVGRKVSSTGQKLEDVLPGVETAAAKGGVKSPKELSAIAQTLGQAKAITGEDTASLADTVVEIIKHQGKQVTGDLFKQTMDAVQGTRTAGAFKDASSAAHAIEGITSGVSADQLKKMGLGTRQMGGLAAMASKGGDQGIQVMQSLLKQMTTAEGQGRLKALFGNDILKGGKLNTDALSHVDKKKFGQYTEQVMGGLANVDQADFSRFVDSMKSGMEDFKKVTNGADETSDQFSTATDNLASAIDRFKEKTKEAGREIGSDLSQMVKALLSGDLNSAMKSGANAGKSLWENKASVAGAVGITAGVGMLMGGGINSLLKKIPGGGALSSVVGGEIAKAEGIQQVYVTNAAEIGGGVSSGLGSLMSAGGMLKTIGGAGAAAGIGIAAGMGINKIVEATTGDKGYFGTKLAEGSGQSDSEIMKAAEAKTNASGAARFNAANNTNLTPEQFAKAVADGTLKALKEHTGQQRVQHTNPSSLTGRGGH